jgi:hypothetical protein
MKTCRKCGLGFGPSSNQIKKQDWLCVLCKREYARDYRNRRKLKGNPVVSTKMPKEYYVAYKEVYYQRTDVKLRTAEYARERRKDPDERRKNFARMKVRRALESGKIERLPCQVCGARFTDAHHEDYSDPLRVVWLCRKHHLEHHAKLRLEKKAKGTQ